MRWILLKTKTIAACEKLDSLEGWERISQEQRDLQRLTKKYISLIKEGNRSLDRGEHHAIADGLWEEAKSVRKQIKKRGVDFVKLANQRIAKAKLDGDYLIEV